MDARQEDPPLYVVCNACVAHAYLGGHVEITGGPNRATKWPVKMTMGATRCPSCFTYMNQRTETRVRARARGKSLSATLNRPQPPAAFRYTSPFGRFNTPRPAGRTHDTRPSGARLPTQSAATNHGRSTRPRRTSCFQDHVHGNHIDATLGRTSCNDSIESRGDNARPTWSRTASALRSLRRLRRPSLVPLLVPEGTRS